MSYIYALYFTEQKAVKIGKANDLLNRLSDLVSTWGNIDPYRAKAWEIDERLVVGGERQLHNTYKNTINKCLKVMVQLSFLNRSSGSY